MIRSLCPFARYSQIFLIPMSSAAAAPSAFGLATGDTLSVKPSSKIAPLIAKVNAQQLKITELENENALLKSEMLKMKSNMEKINKWCSSYAENYETTMAKIKKKFKEYDHNIEVLVQEVGETQEKLATSRLSDSESENIKVLTKQERDAVEASTSAFSDTSMLVYLEIIVL
jgi:hypothetical protein